MADKPTWGGKRENAGRPKGGVTARSIQLLQRLHDAVTDEEFLALYQIVRDIAAKGDSDAVRLRAAMYILDRVLPKQIETIEHVIDGPTSVRDILGSGRYKKVDVEDEAQ